MRASTDEKHEILVRVFTNLETAIKSHGLTRNQIREMTGVNLARYKVSDDMREPSLTSIIKIADALEISLDELCGRSKYVRDMDNWTAGECLDILLKVVDMLVGSFNYEGTGIALAENNVSDAIHDANVFAEHYESAQMLDTDAFPDDPRIAKEKYLVKRIAKMKAESEPIKIREVPGMKTEFEPPFGELEALPEDLPF